MTTDQIDTDEPGAFRRADMTRLRANANQLRAAMLSVAVHNAEFTKVYGTIVKNEQGWDQLRADLEALAGLARMEE